MTHPQNRQIITCPTEEELLAVAAHLAKSITSGVIYLNGPLGAGKTTFVRGFLRALGYQGKVKSPTYTLIENYEIADRVITHVDLYRLDNPAELEQIGMREYFVPGTICLIEWPDKGEGYLPKPNIICDIEFAEQGRVLTLSLF